MDSGQGDTFSSGQSVALAKKFKMLQVLFCLLGIVVFGVVEIVRATWFSSLSPWTIRGVFMPIGSLIVIVAMYSSLGMQKEIKEKLKLDPIDQTIACIESIVNRNEPDLMRMMKGISYASNIYGFILGNCFSLIVFSYVF